MAVKNVEKYVLLFFYFIYFRFLFVWIELHVNFISLYLSAYLYLFTVRTQVKMKQFLPTNDNAQLITGTPWIMSLYRIYLRLF